MKTTARRGLALAAGLTGLVIALSGCSSSGTSTASTTGTDTSKHVQLEFWSWAPGYTDAAKIWNAKHPETQVKITQIKGSDYTKMLTAVKAGSGPCLAQVGYQVLPQFVIDGAVENISKYTDGFKKEFTPVAWNYVSIANGVYAVPVDTAPMAFFYNKPLLEKYGITSPPKTWQEYQADAESIHKQDPSVSLGYFSDDPTFWAGVSQQAGAEWFTLNKDSWTVNIPDAATTKVAGLWQGMINDGSIPVIKSYTPALYKAMNDGKVLSETFGIWDSATLKQNITNNAGSWAVAPIPVWSNSPDTYADMGGSSTAVLKGCKYPDRAVDFAHWMSTSTASWQKLITVGGIWPSSLNGLKSPALDQTMKFFGGENIYTPFKKISATMTFNTTWGPDMNLTNTDFQNGMGRVTKSKTIGNVLNDVQKSTVSAMKSDGLTVKQ